MTSRRRPFPKLTVARIAVRDGAVCAATGVTQGLSAQHRYDKGMGGSALAERPSNGIILEVMLNVRLEQDAREAERARRMGWKLSKWDDPTEVPFWHAPSQTWWLADDEGGKTPAPREVVIAHLERFAPYVEPENPPRYEGVRLG